MTVTTQVGPNVAIGDGRIPVPASTGRAHAVYLDLDTVLLAMHRGRRGIELGVQGDVREGIERLSQIVDEIVVLAYPPVADGRKLPDGARIDALRVGLGDATDELLIVACPHDGDPCECPKPGSALIAAAIERHGLSKRGDWFIGADQEGVVSGRNAGLHTIRIGPLGLDHLSSVHRPDFEARDLLDAANHILLEELS
jgi:hypothetical protein